MEVIFLGQGFTTNTDNSVGTHIQELCIEDVYHTFWGISAFASEAGIQGLSNCLSNSKKFRNINIIVGIDQDGTSRDALEKINELNVNSYFFYQKEAPIFHPKIYIFEGEEKTRIIIGSSNLTARGLFNNIESSILFKYNKDDQDGTNLLKSIKDYYSSLFDFSDQNIFKITSDTISDLVNLGIVPSKRIWIIRQGKKATTSLSLDSELKIPLRRIAYIPSSFRGAKDSKKLLLSTIEETEQVDNSNLELQNLVEVWKSKPLTERDLNIPTGPNTNATGSMLLKKGLLNNIDQREFFRNHVFSQLNWQPHLNPAKAHLEKSSANFEIKINGKSRGIFKLTINHNSDTSSKAYLQNNSMTSLSWGNAKPVIANQKLLGKTLTLLKVDSVSDEFIISIE